MVPPQQNIWRAATTLLPERPAPRPITDSKAPHTTNADIKSKETSSSDITAFNPQINSRHDTQIEALIGAAASTNQSEEPANQNQRNKKQRTRKRKKKRRKGKGQKQTSPPTETSITNQTDTSREQPAAEAKASIICKDPLSSSSKNISVSTTDKAQKHWQRANATLFAVRGFCPFLVPPSPAGAGTPCYLSRESIELMVNNVAEAVRKRTRIM